MDEVAAIEAVTREQVGKFPKAPPLGYLKIDHPLAGRFEGRVSAEIMVKIAEFIYDCKLPQVDGGEGR